MYRSNLSFESVTKYLAWLTSIGLLQKEPSTRKYQTTKKGKELLFCWSETCKLLRMERQKTAKSMMPRAEQHFNYNPVWQSFEQTHVDKQLNRLSQPRVLSQKSDSYENQTKNL
jgi:hypothetical protein